MSPSVDSIRETLDKAMGILQTSDAREYISSEHQDYLLTKHNSLLDEVVHLVAKQHSVFFWLRTTNFEMLSKKCDLLVYEIEQLIRSGKLRAKVKDIQTTVRDEHAAAPVASEKVKTSGWPRPSPAKQRRSSDETPATDHAVPPLAATPVREQPGTSQSETPHSGRQRPGSYMPPGTFNDAMNYWFQGMPGNQGHEYAFPPNLFESGFVNLDGMLENVTSGVGFTVNIGGHGCRGATINKVEVQPINWGHPPTGKHRDT